MWALGLERIGKSQNADASGSVVLPVIINTFAIEHSITPNGIIVSSILNDTALKRDRCSFRPHNKKPECWTLVPDDPRRRHVGLERIGESQNAPVDLLCLRIAACR